MYKWNGSGRECLSMNEYVGYRTVLTGTNGVKVKTYWQVLH